MPERRTPHGTHSDNRAQLFNERQCERRGRKKPTYPAEYLARRKFWHKSRGIPPKSVSQEDGRETEIAMTWGFALTEFDDAQSPPIINKILWDNSVFVPESTLETQLFPEPLMRRIRWRGQGYLAPNVGRRRFSIRPRHLGPFARRLLPSLELIHPSYFSRSA